MRLSIRSQKDFVTGLVFLACGAGFAIGAQSYTVGTAARMGPGYFPTLLGVLLALIGLVIAAQALHPELGPKDKIGSIAWKPLVFILGANILFGLLLVGVRAIGLPSMGLIVAIFGLTIVASLAGERFSLKESLILAAVLAGGSYLAFIVLLKLNFPVWPAFVSP
jgi:hypothetical protein